jgi:mRNA-degrading endonuclease RelE of RelBE toxin-antitoxin system
MAIKQVSLLSKRLRNLRQSRLNISGYNVNHVQRYMFSLRVQLRLQGGGRGREGEVEYESLWKYLVHVLS